MRLSNTLSSHNLKTSSDVDSTTVTPQRQFWLLTVLTIKKKSFVNQDETSASATFFPLFLLPVAACEVAPILSVATREIL